MVFAPGEAKGMGINMEQKNILDEMKEKKSMLPRQQQQLCDYILSKPIEASTPLPIWSIGIMKTVR